MALASLLFASGWTLNGVNTPATGATRAVTDVFPRGFVRTGANVPIVMEAAVGTADVETTKMDTANLIGVVVPSNGAKYVAPEPLQLQDGDALEAKWDKLRGTSKRAQLRRSMALQTFFLKAGWKTVRANMTDDEARTAMTAAWVRDGLLNLGPTMIKLGQVFSSRKDLLHPAYCEHTTSGYSMRWDQLATTNLCQS